MCQTGKSSGQSLPVVDDVVAADERAEYDDDDICEAADQEVGKVVVVDVDTSGN